MKKPSKILAEFVLAKLKLEIYDYLQLEITFIEDSEGKCYGFSQEETDLYKILCTEMIESLENTTLSDFSLSDYFSPNTPW